MPVPVPAVVELTKGIPVERTSINGEITTPTGAAVVTTLASSYGPVTLFVAESTGYGAGTKQFETHPNVLRIVIGETPGVFESDQCVCIETNIDDMNPEFYGYVMSKLFAAGAKDVFMVPVYMKKNRPGTLLSVISEESTADAITGVILSETSSIGVRMHRVYRKKLHRETHEIETSLGTVRIKTAASGTIIRKTPEYDDCVKIAGEKGLPVQDVYRIIQNDLMNDSKR